MQTAVRKLTKKTAIISLLTAFIFVCEVLAEIGVNTHTTNNQSIPAIAMNSNGHYVVVWSSYLQDGSSGGIFGRLFDPNGQPRGGEFGINTTTIDNQTAPDVAMNDSGSFIVTWHGQGIDVEDIFARFFEPNGQPLDIEFQVNSYTASEQLNPSVAMNNDGNSVIVWESRNVPADLEKRSIRGQLYDSLGAAVGPEFNVNDPNTTGNYRNADVAMYSNSEFTVVWLKDSSTKSLWARNFDSHGSSPYRNSQVNVTNFTSLTQPSIAIDSAGGYVIAWDGHQITYTEDNIYIRRYHWSHAPIDPCIINTYKTGAQTNPSIAMSSDGRFVVVWQSETETAADALDVFGQRFEAQGENIGDTIFTGGQFLINTYTVDDQKFPSVAISDNGGFVTVWQSDEQDGSGSGIFAQSGPKAGSADFTDNCFVDFTDFCVLAEQWLDEDQSLEADLIDDNIIDELDIEAFGRQWLNFCFDCSQVDIESDGWIDLKDFARWAEDFKKQGPNLDGDIDANGKVNKSDLKPLIAHWLKNCL